MAYVIAGLGNPGKTYERTRHNAGFLVLDRFAQDLSCAWNASARLHADICETNVGGEKVVLAKPMTFMNLSGEAISAILHKYHIAPDRLVIAYDDADLPFGTVRVRQNGSSGGHNGLKSIIRHIGSEQFLRLRIGVGEPPAFLSLEDWVLKPFSKQEREQLTTITREASNILRQGLETGTFPQTTRKLLSDNA